ncbi:hypothetical protein [Dinoroseobacter sp. S124A]|uniref:hypothetical protein n=1 Tax=Dinoroseobacter sp. S124A TaxID=3415128 RepID=UPI003C7D80CA
MYGLGGLDPNGGLCHLCSARNTPGFGVITCAQCGTELAPDRQRDLKQPKPWHWKVFWGLSALILCAAMASNPEVRQAVKEFCIPLSQSSGP